MWYKSQRTDLRQRFGREAKLSLQNIIREAPDQHELHLAWSEIEKPSNDRAAAIMAGAFVEDALRRVVGGSSTFNSMIEAGFTRGLYEGLVRNDLHVIRRVRNAFAHAIKPINFDTPDVIKEVAKFQYVRWIQITGGLPFGPARQANPHRETYTNICRALINDLFMVAISGGAELELSEGLGPHDNSLSAPH